MSTQGNDTVIFTSTNPQVEESKSIPSSKAKPNNQKPETRESPISATRQPIETTALANSLTQQDLVASKMSDRTDTMQANFQSYVESCQQEQKDLSEADLKDLESKLEGTNQVKDKLLDLVRASNARREIEMAEIKGLVQANVSQKDGDGRFLNQKTMDRVMAIPLQVKEQLFVEAFVPQERLWERQLKKERERQAAKELEISSQLKLIEKNLSDLGELMTKRDVKEFKNTSPFLGVKENSTGQLNFPFSNV